MSYLKALSIATLAIFLPIKPILIAALVLCVFDMLTGVAAAIKQKQKVTSKGFGRTVVKILVYEVSLILGYVVQQYLIQNSIPVTNLIGSMIGLVELKSVLENMDIITGDSFFQTLISKLGSQSSKP